MFSSFSMEHVEDSWKENSEPYDNFVQFLHEERVDQFYSKAISNWQLIPSATQMQRWAALPEAPLLMARMLLDIQQRKHT